ncbi:hypothetical protein BGZ76_010312 [Entomortierella beljakovae]|nr:hypothetical protein BGZ76_010312 [Entomortierella beljakovae]
MMKPTEQGIEYFMEEIECSQLLESLPLCDHPNNSSLLWNQQSLSQRIDLPMMGGRTGSVDNMFRDGHLVGPGNTGGSSGDGNGDGNDGGAPRQTPTQDISSAMVETNQEIRQLREQLEQQAMTDRVKRLSKTSDSAADKDRFVRSMDYTHPMDDSAGMGMGMGMGSSSSSILNNNITTSPGSESPKFTSTAATSPGQEEIVRQIAQRVSQKLKEAAQRGDTTASYQALLAEEIVKEQLAGVLPVSPAESRKNSAHTIDPEDAEILRR